MINERTWSEKVVSHKGLFQQIQFELLVPLYASCLIRIELRLAVEFSRINSASFGRTIRGFCAVDGQALPAEQQEKAPSFIQDGLLCLNQLQQKTYEGLSTDLFKL